MNTYSYKSAKCMQDAVVMACVTVKIAPLHMKYLLVLKKSHINIHYLNYFYKEMCFNINLYFWFIIKIYYIRHR